MDARITDKLEELASTYRILAKQYPEALIEITIAETAESVYQSNAIENSTLTLDDTEHILAGRTPGSMSNLREVFEAVNLAKVTEHVVQVEEPVSPPLILHWHGMLLAGIRDEVAGRFRRAGEWVRVGNHIGANPAFVSGLINDAFREYREDSGNNVADIVERVARFHCEFEVIHPFVDGNGRIGRVIINAQLQEYGLPPVIVRAKNREKDYYPMLDSYAKTNSSEGMTKLLTLLTLESMHKRIALITSKRVVTLTEWASRNGVTAASAANKAKRQTIPAFRLRDRWMIAENAQ